MLVLRKTKLGEKDLILSMLDESGALVKGVAKGARKPGGSFAARLESFVEADVLLAEGRSLDVVCEAKIVNPTRGLVWGLEQSACAAPLAELLCNIAQPNLPQPRIFDISRAAFNLMGSGDANAHACLALAAASLWKVMAQIGFRPSFTSCVLCGEPVSYEGSRRIALSPSDGGIICEACMRPADALLVDVSTIAWCEAFIRMKFVDVMESDASVETIMDALHLARTWARVHTGRNLKSLDFIFTSGMFG